MSGIYLPPEYFTGTWKIRLQRLWAIIIRLSLLFSKSISTYNMILDATSSVSVSITFVFYLCVVTIVLQSLVLIPTFFAVSKKLNSKCHMVELEYYYKALPKCFLVFLVSALSGVLPIYVFPFKSSPLLVFFLFGEYSVSLFLALATMLIAVDAGACRSLVAILSESLSKRELTLSQFNSVRDSVRTRLKESEWSSTAVVLVAILDIIVMVLLLLFSQAMAKVKSLAFVVLMSTFFIKEIPFLFIILWYSAMVNEASDKLTTVLGTSVWGERVDLTEEETRDPLKQLQLVRSSLEKEQIRHSLYINALTHKISMPLGFMRLTRKDILVRFGVWSVSLLIGVAKTIIDSSVENSGG